MKMKIIANFISGLLLLTVAGLWSGCVAHHYQSSSVVQYLYPEKTEPIVTPTIPTLVLPLKVGIAFVPESTQSKRGQTYTMYSDHASSFTEKDKISLMRDISSHFKQYEFIHSIEVIPSAYLQPEGSFTNLDQIRTMYGIDVIALVSYDQHQFTDEGVVSLSYWTIIGAYIVPGEKNDTHTMLDITVYDIKSRKMLFRAPGLSRIDGKATPVNLTEALRIDSFEGFQLASKDLIVNLDEQLKLFEEKVKESPKEYKVVRSSGYTGGGSGYTGGGSVDILLVVLSMMAGSYGLWSNRRKRA